MGTALSTHIGMLTEQVLVSVPKSVILPRKAVQGTLTSVHSLGKSVRSRLWHKMASEKSTKRQ